MSTGLVPNDSLQSSVQPRVTQGGRLVFLDVIRGVAVLLVLGQHLMEYIYAPFVGWSMQWFSSGRAGVAAFFLVSGFVIPYSLERVGTLRHFWVSRFFRLYPIYWLSIGIVLCMYFAGFRQIGGRYDGHVAKVTLVNLTMLQGLLGVPDMIVLYWTLTLELLFYVLVSVLFILKLNRYSYVMAWVGLVGILFAALVDAFVWPKVPTARLALIGFALIGTAVFRYFSGELSRRKFTTLLVASVVGYTTALWVSFPKPWEIAPSAEKWGAVGMIASHALAGLLFAALFLLRAGTFPSALRWLGAISYSVYLLHYPIMILLARIPHYGPVSGPAWALLVIGLSVGAATLTFRYVERPAIAMGRRFLESRTSAQKSDATVMRVG